MLAASKHTKAHSRAQLGENHRYAWKERTYVVPSASRKKFQWKASALRGLERISKAGVTGHPVTVVVPALYNFMPAEALASGWFNEIDALGVIRHRIADAARITDWDVFTFHTRHNLDPYYASTIAAVRDTWLHEGTLSRNTIAGTIKRFGPEYRYNCISARLVESLVFQSSLIGWLKIHAEDAPLRFHVIGTGLLSALVFSGALTFDGAVRIASKLGTRWDDELTDIVRRDLERKGKATSEENVGWLRFHRVRQILEGRYSVPLDACTDDIVAAADAPSCPFWFSVTPNDEPVLLETVRDVQFALESMNLKSWSPRLPKALPTDSRDRVRGWLVSPLHPAASACRWSMYNYLLATPESSLLFLDHIAGLGRRPVVAPQSDEFQERLRLSRIKVTGP